MKINIVKVNADGYEVRMPEFDGDSSIGYAFSRVDNYIVIPPHSRCLVNLGFGLEMDSNIVCEIRPVLDLALTEKIDVLPVAYDSSYTDELKVLVENNSDGAFSLFNGKLICRIMFTKIYKNLRRVIV